MCGAALPSEPAARVLGWAAAREAAVGVQADGVIAAVELAEIPIRVERQQRLDPEDAVDHVAGDDSASRRFLHAEARGGRSQGVVDRCAAGG